MTILIAGGSCSGKSTLARALAESIPGATHIPLDQFFRRDDPAGPQVNVGGTIMFDCNHPETIDLEAALQIITNTPEPRTIDSHFGLYYPELRELATLKVFVDCPGDIRGSVGFCAIHREALRKRWRNIILLARVRRLANTSNPRVSSPMSFWMGAFPPTNNSQIS